MTLPCPMLAARPAPCTQPVPERMLDPFLSRRVHARTGELTKFFDKRLNARQCARVRAWGAAAAGAVCVRGLGFIRTFSMHCGAPALWRDWGDAALHSQAARSACAVGRCSMTARAPSAAPAQPTPLCVQVWELLAHYSGKLEDDRDMIYRFSESTKQRLLESAAEWRDATK